MSSRAAERRAESYPLNGRRFEVIPVCVDRRECRQRVEQLGEVWPLALVSSDRIQDVVA